MRTLRSRSKKGLCLASFLAVLTCGTKTFAQTTDSNLVPVVNIRATQPIATTNHPGVFTVFRYGNTNATLNVWYDLGGSTSNGADYATIPWHLVEIPAGATSNTIVITPLTNPPPSSAVKTVVVTLTNSPLMTPVNYEIGSPSQAAVYIANAGITNLPPQVSIMTPTNGEPFFVPTNGGAIISSIIRLGATASDPDGYVTNVEFFANGADLGSGLPLVTDPPSPIGIVWYLSWANPSAGNYTLTAVATDNGGLSATSASVKISVVNVPPPTNVPPAVRIDSPTNGATFFGHIVCPPCITNNPPCEAPCYYAGPDIPIFATGSTSSGVAAVEFFADGQDLGPGILEDCIAPAGNCVGCPPPVLTCTYSMVWSNAPVGIHALTAVATDNGGLSTTSAPVNISVQGPPTNLPPVVRIISPANGSVFRAPVSLPLYAYADDGAWGTDGLFNDVTNVEFYADGTDLGSAKHVLYVPPPTPGGVYPNYVTLLPDHFFLIWSNAPVGLHHLDALAQDQFGNSATSSPVNITILSSPPPPTNRPPIVSIVASDPVAIEGTNCWVWPGETNATPAWATWPTAVCRYFTNCGPKTATFTIRRLGETNDDSTVTYNIGGTASNGVDYVALPGFVTIPAGERRALITIVPIDDGPPDVNKTVILTLLPDMQMNPLPGYVLGFPRRAAAIILDPGPRPVVGSLVGRCFHFKATGPDAAWFCIEYSTNMVNWTPVCTNQVINGSIDFVDPDADGNASRFYRAVPLTTPPSE